MHRTEERETESCVVCGADILPERDVAYGVGSETVMCQKCAVARGGVYDEIHDHWDQPPDVSALPES